MKTVKFNKEMQAIQFTNTEENLEELKEFLEIEGNLEIEECSLIIDDYTEARIGEWIIKNDGFYVESEENFEKYYTIINN